jgi:hypothetical protein
MKSAWLHDLKQQFGAWVRGGYAPERITAWEWFLMRLGCAAVVMWEFRDWHPFDAVKKSSPVGLARILDLSWLSTEGAFERMVRPLEEGWGMLDYPGRFETMLVLGTVCCLLYVLNIGLRWVLPVLALAHTLIWTHFNSQGFQHHGHQLVSMVLWVQVAVVWWKRAAGSAELRSWMWFYVRGLILFSYVASAFSKVINSRGLWLWNSQYLPAEIVKSHRLSYYKELDPMLAGDPPIALWLREHIFAAQLIFGIGFFIELLAWLGLRDRRWSALMGVSIILFHFNISWLMRLEFDNHVWLCAIFLLNVPGWIALAYWRLARPQPAL